MALTNEQKAQILKDFGVKEGDTGSPEVQVALLTEPALRLDLGAKPRCAGSGIALESGDRGVLILDHAGDGAERTVGDVPCKCAAKLTGGYLEHFAIMQRRDRQGWIRARQFVINMVPESVE